MKTYKITRTETIQEEVIVQAKNEEQATIMFEHEKKENPIILSSDTNIEVIKEKKQ